MNQKKLKAFAAAYLTGLAAAVKADQSKPEESRDYTYGPEEVPKVVERMLRAIETNPLMVNYDSSGIRRTCTILGIPGTRKAILKYLEG